MVTVLMEHTVPGRQLLAEHGLACHIKAGAKSLLFAAVFHERRMAEGLYLGMRRCSRNSLATRPVSVDGFSRSGHSPLPLLDIVH